MKVALPFPLALLVLLAASGAGFLRAEPELASTPSSPKTPPASAAVEPIVGKWAWHDHVTAVFRADGTGTTSNNDELTWRAIRSQPGTHCYEVTWAPRGFHDELTINDGAQTAQIIGDKQENYTARRIITDPIVGKWAWHHHDTVTFEADGTCAWTDGARGKWRLVDGSDAERKYTIDFDNGRFKDELIFHKDGRTALLVGNSRENYTVSKVSE